MTGMRVLARVVVTLPAILFTSCDTTLQSRNQASAVEIFRLRSECAALGEKILERDIVGPALTHSQLSKYDSTSNRCYVNLTVSSADVARFETSSEYLYDGQTGEMIAWKTLRGDKRTGSILATGLIPLSRRTDGTYQFSYDNASALIGALMKEDRQIPASMDSAK